MSGARNRFMAWLVLGVAVGSIDGVRAAPPNIVLIISDDQAWNDYGFMGHPTIRTPNLDRLASEGLVFVRGYVPDSLCRPSLATIISGRYPHEHGIVGNDPPVPPNAGRGPQYAAAREEYLRHIDRLATIPKWLAPRGYLSFQAGKWWEGHYSRGGFTHGMTHGDPRKGGRHGDDGLKIGREGLGPVREFLTMAKERTQPFFLWYAPMLPHAPHNPPDRLLAHYADKTGSPFIAKYWAMCEWWDESCGELLAMLDELGVSDNTMVVYVTDNGWINRPDSGQFAPKSKRSPYDGGIRTPVMVRWPGHVDPQREEHLLVSSVDLAPTILKAVGVAPPADLSGRDLLDREGLVARESVQGGIFEHDVRHMSDPAASLMYRWIVAGDWKLIVPHGERVPEGDIELYRLDRDPWESRNLAADHPDVVGRLGDALDAWWQPGKR
ncbi:MAG: sulfatase [Planctomycetes bacterium]|nr:sulfatase [Planctomycetota bacterium]